MAAYLLGLCTPAVLILAVSAVWACLTIAFSFRSRDADWICSLRNPIPIAPRTHVLINVGRGDIGPVLDGKVVPLPRSGIVRWNYANDLGHTMSVAICLVGFRACATLRKMWS
ncbi:MAG: hypothetical protein ABL912_01785 [Novosphingobium sp.]